MILCVQEMSFIYTLATQLLQEKQTKGNPTTIGIDDYQTMTYIP